MGEEGHWEDIMIADRIYRCNQCRLEFDTLEELDEHQAANFDWETMTGTCWSYTVDIGDPYPSGEKQWVVDKPGHIEYQWQTVTEEVWVEEVGHWEYK